MTTATSQDTEITLGLGKMLALFFGLVVICAAFFGMGYSLGRSSVKLSASDMPPAAPVTTGSARPSAIKSTGAAPSDSASSKTVAYKDTDNPIAARETSSDITAGPNANSAPDAAPILSGNAYYVQVAAVSKEEDAVALVDALKKKQYPAFSANTPPDKLFHVQVGPYTDVKDAEAMRGKLVSDGYNPILKK